MPANIKALQAVVIPAAKVVGQKTNAARSRLDAVDVDCFRKANADRVVAMGLDDPVAIAEVDCSHDIHTKKDFQVAGQRMGIFKITAVLSMATVISNAVVH